jgi:pimeloyl-ACP methyl ester carboxylesterase
VTAIDQAGNRDTSPAVHAWTVDRRPPTAPVVRGLRRTVSATPFYRLSAKDSVTKASALRFRCRLNTRRLRRCAARPRLHLARGKHVLHVEALDEAGNRSPSARVFAASFAADVPPELAAFMADAQVPWGVGGPNGIVSEAAWRSKPSWYLVTTDDRMIPPSAQRTMAERIGATVTETPGSHAVYVSNPGVVAGLISQAARSALRETTAVG